MSEQQATSCWAGWRDLAVYGPIGLVSLAVEELPKAAEASREKIANRIATARVVGEFAVRMGTAYVTRRLDDITAERLAGERAAAEAALIHEADVARAADHADVGDDGSAAATETSAVDDIGDVIAAMSEGTSYATDDNPVPASESIEESAEETGDMATATDLPVPPLVEELALSDYDSLAASQIVARLEALPADELEAIRRYESAHRQRRTVTGKIQQLQNAPT